VSKETVHYRYVVGFGFTKDKQKVLLINKLKPEWQKGYLNGIGGKIEISETPIQAMNREAYEEAGLLVDWSCRGVMQGTNNDGSKFKCHIFSTTEIEKFKQVEDEILELVNVRDISNRSIVANLKFLIPFCITEDYAFMTLDYSYKQAKLSKHKQRGRR
jgi:8-oxo-dGTP diphosphatase